ncbi:hypothetical protein Nepgr_018724 [Nepenthes gracilis]|uniref:Uncharacterized protein n=1 Tax=Nepenthes gracilis TaxID=150966 RepID=A0AAD3SSQ1_NEPGR|nr:hypothetical protein Nepgr_018724 [Nepenthes gracilis]
MMMENWVLMTTLEPSGLLLGFQVDVLPIISEPMLSLPENAGAPNARRQKAADASSSLQLIADAVRAF